MRFLVLIHDAGHDDAGAPPDALMEAVAAFRADTTYGTWLDDGGLAPASEALRWRTEAGRTTVVDGPYAEAKEVVGGFFVVESGSTDDIARWVEGFVDLHAHHWPQLSYTAEVRQIIDPTV